MNGHAITDHASRRMRQRGLRGPDLDLILAAATPLKDDVWLMTNSATDEEIARRKREIEQLQRLRGCKVVVAGEAVVTLYHTTPKTQRRATRQGRDTQ